MKLFILLTTTLLAGITSFAQTDSTTAPAPDSTVAKKSTLTVGAVYANNASYYGQKSSEQTPYAAVAASYKFKSGFYLSALAYKLLNDKTSGISAANAGVGFSFKLSKKLSADINYNHSFFAAYSPLLQSGNTENAAVGLTYETFINIALTGDAAFGKSKDGFVTAAISKSINLFSIGKKDIVTINPSADVVAGTQHFYETYLEEKKLRDSVLGIILNPITGGNSSTSGTKTVEKTDFNILSYNFKLPLAYNRAHYMIEACYQLSVLSQYAKSGAGNVNSFFTASFYYQF